MPQASPGPCHQRASLAPRVRQPSRDARALPEALALEHELTHREQAEHIRAKLVEEFQTLKLFEVELKRRPDQTVHERLRVDMVSVAIEHVQQAMDALELASRE